MDEFEGGLYKFYVNMEKYDEIVTVVQQARAVSCKRGCMPADSVIMLGYQLWQPFFTLSMLTARYHLPRVTLGVMHVSHLRCLCVVLTP